jgi:hypothetical protein
LRNRDNKGFVKPIAKGIELLSGTNRGSGHGRRENEMKTREEAEKMFAATKKELQKNIGHRENRRQITKR